MMTWKRTNTVSFLQCMETNSADDVSLFRMANIWLDMKEFGFQDQFMWDAVVGHMVLLLCQPHAMGPHDGLHGQWLDPTLNDAIVHVGIATSVPTKP
jgi:hypothetical protein